MRQAPSVLAAAIPATLPGRWKTLDLIAADLRLGSRPVQRAEHGLHGRQFNVGVHAGAPAGAAIAVFHLDVGNGDRLFAGAEGVFVIIRDFEARHAGGPETMDERGQRPVAFAEEFDRRIVTQQARVAADHAVAALGFESLETPGRGALDVLAPEHRLQLGAAYLAAQAVHFLVGDGAEFALHFLGQLDAELAFEQIGHAALAGLAVDADDLAVFAANVRRVDRQIRHVPVLTTAAFPFSQALADRVLMRTAESGKDQFARVRLARRHRHSGATFVNFEGGVKVGEVELRINAVHVEVQRDRYDVQVAGAFAVAEKRAFDAVGAGEQAQLRRRHAGATVVVRVQADDERIAVADVAANPLDLVRVNVRHRDFDGVGQVQNHFPARCRPPAFHHCFEDGFGELDFAA